MSKKKWLLTVIILAFVGYLIISKVQPGWGYGIDNVVGGAVGNFKAGIEASPIWQQYDIWFSGAFFTIVTAFLMWQGHNAYNKVRGIAVRSAVREAGYQSVPTAQPVIIPTTPTATVAPQAVVAEALKEEEAVA